MTLFGALGFLSPWLLLGLLALPVLWWLLRAVPPAAAAILAFARPVLNPDARDIGSGPLLVLMDGGWASAPDWRKRQVWLEGALNSASRDGRPVALVSMTQAVPSEGALTFRDADAAVERLALMEPRSYGPDRAGYADWISSQDVDDFDTIWVHDGLEVEGSDALVEALKTRGNVTMVGGSGAPDALRPAVLEEGVLKITAIRSRSSHGG